MGKIGYGFAPLGLVLLACSSPEPASTCSDGTCDQADREYGVGNLCEERHADAFSAGRESLTSSKLRWSCADVPEAEDQQKGQEYCESFAIVRLPAMGTTVARGRQPSDEGPEEWSDRYIDLSDGDFVALDELSTADPTAQAGACIFTSWQSDIYDPLTVCQSDEACADYLGLPLTGINFRMRHEVNSLTAAEALVEDCLQTYAGVTNFDGSPVEDPFMRGCLINQLINRTSYRKSDTTICTAALRMTECGCYPTSPGLDFADVLGGLQLRGFHLSSWASFNKPPPGCHYVETGYRPNEPKVRNLIACPLTAAEVLAHATADGGQVDLKSYCDERYAEEIAVQIPITPAQIECKPSSSSSPYADTCDDFTQPWALGEPVE